MNRLIREGFEQGIPGEKLAEAAGRVSRVNNRYVFSQLTSIPVPLTEVRNGFDSRQLHWKDTGQSHKLWPVFFFINISSTFGGYAAGVFPLNESNQF